MRFFLAALFALLVWGAAADAAHLKKTALVFEFDEGLGNGVTQNADVVAVRRMAQAVKAFAPKFEVYALVAVSVADRNKLTAVLDALQDEGLPFLLEAQSSDTIQTNFNGGDAPFDAAHGFGASVEELRALRETYGAAFAGIRFMETFGLNQQLVGCRLFKADWCGRFAKYMPEGNYFDRRLIEPYVAFAAANGMFALFGDHYWAANYDPRRRTYDGRPYFSEQAVVTPKIFEEVIRQPQNERDLQALAAKYPGTLVALYDNNDGAGGVDSSAAKFDDWDTKILKPLVASGGFRGFGLSDQSWLCPDRPYNNNGAVCPVSGVIAWARNALAKGALVIETEPAWYWFRLPPGAEAVRDYTGEPEWAERGAPTANLRALAAALGVKLP